MESKPAAKPSTQNKYNMNVQLGIDPNFQNATSDESQNYLYPETTDDDYTNDKKQLKLNASINTNITHFDNQNIPTTSNLNNSPYSIQSTPNCIFALFLFCDIGLEAGYESITAF